MLQFPTESPVRQSVRKSITHLSSSESPVEERIELHVEAETAVSGEELKSRFTTPPFNLSLTLKRLNVEMKTEEGTLSFDSSSPGSSLFLAQFGELAERPLPIRVEEGFVLKPETPKIVRTLQELPGVKDLHPEDFIRDFFYFQFALAGEELEEGKSYVRPLPQASGGVLFKEITYTVEKIDEKNIRARIFAASPPRKKPLTEPFNSDNEAVTEMTMMLSGTIDGTLVWDRENALRYRLESVQSYEGRFDLMDEEIVMQFKVDHEVYSQ